METDVTIDCTSTDYQESIGLWQWITESADKKYVAKNNLFICRYGALADNQPSCPWGSCANSDCSICDPWTA